MKKQKTIIMKRHFIYALMGLVFSLSLALSSIVLAVPDKWTKKADMPTARLDLSTSAVNGKIYAIGGYDLNGNNMIFFSTVEEYDPKSNTWTMKADVPTARAGFSTGVVNGKIYAIGGSASQKFPTEEYDPVTNKWTKKADMLTTRFGFSASVVNGKIYAIGGKDINEKIISTVEEYDPKSNKWTLKADMPTARWYLSTSAVNGKIYAIGGMNINGGRIFSTVEEYDPVLDIWTKKNDMPTGMVGLSASVVNDKIYTIGGIGFDGNTWTSVSTVEEYDPVSDIWTKKNDMPTARTYLSASVVGGKIYAIGGYGIGDIVLSAVEEYDTGFAGENVEAKDKLATKWGKLKGDER